MTLVILHYHLRPGGVRRVIELATPYLAREVSRPVTRILLATGEAPDRRWQNDFANKVAKSPVQLLVEPSFKYTSEQRKQAVGISANIRRALQRLLQDCDANNTIVWAHNLGVGRNLPLARELSEACAARGIRLIAHHHDWWFDNRWARWHEMRRLGIRTASDTARSLFTTHPDILHAAINFEDYAILSKHFGKNSIWLPNLVEREAPPAARRVREARRWLGQRLSEDGAPVWLLPCRTLRRKNIAEALLLTRWLRPSAWLVVTGGASSADETPYFKALQRAAERNQWPLRLGVLAGGESQKPLIPELLAASEAVLLTSIQEGFGLPYLEAAASRRPLIARRLPNIAPDLQRFGFLFPQTYDEILIGPELFDWAAERSRQLKMYSEWRKNIPEFARSHVAVPPVLVAREPCAVPFSRLTLGAQLEILARPVAESWASCAPLNPFLNGWRQRACRVELRVTPWPRSVNRWIGGKAYARRFAHALKAPAQLHKTHTDAPGVQADFVAAKLNARNLYPLLWSTKA